MGDLTIRPSRGLRGELTPPGDKSLSHRAVMLSGIAEGTTAISGFLTGEDTMHTARAMRALGVAIEDSGGGNLTVRGRGLRGLTEPADVLDMGNSGTGMRLLAGLLAGQDFFSVLTGDQYLRKRPMARIAEPLRSMGAGINGRAGGKLAPLAINGAGAGCRAIAYASPVASAQIKSAILLCGLFADGVTTVTEPHKSRDHTERMLRFFGVEVKEQGNRISLRGGQRLSAPLSDLVIPSDISSAAFFLVAGAVVPGSDVVVRNVGVNPTRTGILDVLQRMGADIELLNAREQAGEPVADIRVRHRKLKATRIGGEDIPRLIDEIPVLAVAAAVAEGTTVISDAAELRVKESDRIATVAGELAKLGAVIRERPDGMEIAGKDRLSGSVCESHGDHRIAMSLAVAGLVAEGMTTVRDTAWIDTSFPGFERTFVQAAYGIS
ncbi:MAG: 3-phosphoshikimate 1-carboxyvinyltransferase [Nitrospiraceae bacterium]|nr:3-phosphoshikimate 1-carboxyvinyltransferase [Nitrospiraceae bacterium]